MRAGTLYAALNRLATESLAKPDLGEMVDARSRRYDRVTPQAPQGLKAEVARMRSRTAMAAPRLGLAGAA